MNGSFSLVSLYFPQREIAIPYLRKKPLLSHSGKKRLFAYASLKEGALGSAENFTVLPKPPSLREVDASAASRRKEFYFTISAS